MPLTRATTTAATWSMLTPYIVLFLALGANYTLNSEGLQSSPGLAYADDWPPHLVGYGLVFLACGLMVAAAMLTGRRDLCRYALILGQYCLYGWAFMFVLAAIFGDASPTGCVIFWALGRACKATNCSLMLGER